MNTETGTVDVSAPRAGDRWKEAIVKSCWAGLVVFRAIEPCQSPTRCCSGCANTTHEGTHFAAVEDVLPVDKFLMRYRFVRPRMEAKKP
jgi:hypothetical protein